MSVSSMYMVAGQSKTRTIQCNTYYVDPSTGLRKPAVYNSDDILTASVFQTRQTTPIFTLAPTWYTADDTQTGYDQAQVQVWPSAAQMALLVPGISYTFQGWRQLGGGGDLDDIFRIPLIVEPIAF